MGFLLCAGAIALPEGKQHKVIFKTTEKKCPFLYPLVSPFLVKQAANRSHKKNSTDQFADQFPLPNSKTNGEQVNLEIHNVENISTNVL